MFTLSCVTQSRPFADSVSTTVGIYSTLAEAQAAGTAHDSALLAAQTDVSGTGHPCHVMTINGPNGFSCEYLDTDRGLCWVGLAH